MSTDNTCQNCRWSRPSKRAYGMNISHFWCMHPINDHLRNGARTTAEVHASHNCGEYEEIRKDYEAPNDH